MTHIKNDSWKCVSMFIGHEDGVRFFFAEGETLIIPF